jgi:hypothetical protein
MTEVNTLNYYDMTKITAVKSSIVQAAGDDVITTFTAVICAQGAVVTASIQSLPKTCRLLR